MSGSKQYPLFHGSACFMRTRHKAEWIATVDLDERIEVQHPDNTPWHLPAYLDSLDSRIHEVLLNHCQLLKENKSTGQWKSWGLGPHRAALYSSNSEVLRNCRSDVAATKAIARADTVPFSFTSYTSCPSSQGTDRCDWRWGFGTGRASPDAAPESCEIITRHPAFYDDCRDRVSRVDGFDDGKYPPSHGNLYLVFKGSFLSYPIFVIMCAMSPFKI